MQDDNGIESDFKKDEQRVEKWWNQAPTWQKAGVIIAALALVIAILMYFKSHPTSTSVAPTDTTNTVPANSPSTTTNPVAGDYIPTTTAGWGDTWPSLNNIPASSTYTTTNANGNTNPINSLGSSMNAQTSNNTYSAATTANVSDQLAAQQTQYNALMSAPPAGPSGLSLGMVAVAPKNSIFSGFGQKASTSSAANSTDTSNSGGQVSLNQLGSGWNMPAAPKPNPPAAPKPSPAAAQHVTVSTSIPKASSFKVGSGFRL